MGRRGLAHARVVADGEDADRVIGAVGVEVSGEVGRGPADDVVVVGVGRWTIHVEKKEPWRPWMKTTSAIRWE